MNFCLNCRVFGDPLVVHRENCPGAILVKLETKRVGMACPRCGHIDFRSNGSPFKCKMPECVGEYIIPVYEYPKELRRS